MATPTTPLSKITTLHTAVSRIIRPHNQTATRAEYGAALELAEDALDVAISTGADTATIDTCRDYQRLCYATLCQAYAKNDVAEHTKYDRRSSQGTVPVPKLDKGKHLAEASEAVRISELLDKLPETRDIRKVRFSDEVEEALAKKPSERKVSFTELAKKPSERKIRFIEPAGLGRARGPSGFTLALALHDLNIPSTVYEAHPENFDQGGGVMLSPNALRVLDRPDHLFGSEKLYGYPAIRIMRKELLDEMKVMLRERHIPVHYDSKLTAITSDGPDKVEFAFENGQVASAPLLIGADGIHSTMRETFLPQVKPIFAGFMVINSVV
ncbi:hypothetical protein F5B20DRAFT_588611 [Whalleya microplaca]|nr:hypothetical protein F5B20DRAFT_588611 [Whalleya microplaca]